MTMTLAYLYAVARDRAGRNNGHLSEQTLLRMIKDAKENPNVRPNFVTYSTVMNAWARAGQPDRAAAVLRSMYDDYQQNGNESAKPDLQSFNTVLKAYTKSTDDDVPEKAEQFFRTLQEIQNQGDLGIRIDTYTYAAGAFC